VAALAPIPLLPLRSPDHGGREVTSQRLLSRWEILRRWFREGSPHEVVGEPLKFVLFLTGGVEHEFIHLLGSSRGPYVLIAHPGHNSLPAALEVAAALRQRGIRTEVLHLGDREAPGRLEVLLRVSELARGLRGKRVGLIGKPSPWLLASCPDLRALEERLGLSFVEIPQEVRPTQAVEPPSGERVEPGEEELQTAAGLHAALRDLVEAEKLDALTIACFDLIREGVTACWALARLPSEGIPAACEGDVPSLIALVLSHLLTGLPGFMGNPVDIDPKGERLLLAHCTAPLALLEGYRLRSHFESGTGVAVEGRLQEGPYTLVRFGGRTLEKGFFVEGKVLGEEPKRPDLCRTQVAFKAPKGALRKLLREPLGNHHVLIPGHHRDVLEAFHSLFLSEDFHD